MTDAPTDTDDGSDVQLTEEIVLTGADTDEAWEDATQFLQMLRTFDEATEAIQELQAEVAALNTGLDEEDAIRLIYGRTGFSLSDVRSFFGALDTIQGADERKLLKRLLADLGNDRLEGADEFLDEVERLRNKYGDATVTDE